MRLADTPPVCAPLAGAPALLDDGDGVLLAQREHERVGDLVRRVLLQFAAEATFIFAAGDALPTALAFGARFLSMAQGHPHQAFEFEYQNAWYGPLVVNAWHNRL